MVLVVAPLLLAAGTPDALQLAASPKVLAVESILAPAEASTLLSALVALDEDMWHDPPPLGDDVNRAYHMPVAEYPVLRKVLDVFSDLWGVDLRSSTHVPAARHPPRSGGLKPHYDTTDATGVVYLHSTPEGTGELHFPLASPELTWAPKAGAMVTWANNVLLKNGTSVLVEEAAHLVTPGTNATGQPRYTLNLNANFLRPKPDRRLLFADKQGGPLPGTLVGFDGLEAGLPSRKSLFSAAAGLSLMYLDEQTGSLMRDMKLARMRDMKQFMMLGATLPLTQLKHPSK